MIVNLIVLVLPSISLGFILGWCLCLACLHPKSCVNWCRDCQWYEQLTKKHNPKDELLSEDLRNDERYKGD